ncbi:MAG TPA: PQQ-dependent sugar dehydrogenase, partial [Geminicoccaceae bacterium]|nr:PQQ-dependent sugar dehydrogenase [Geminicoccaceae bacterium]
MATIFGTPDDENLTGTARDDRISGLAGDDVIRGLGGDDVLLGGPGDDRLIGNAGDDRLFGGFGNDELQGGLGNDTLNGGPGNDRLFGQAGDDQLAGGDGADRLRGGEGADRMAGGAGNDLLFGEAGDDRLAGDAGDDVLNGGDGRDVLRGGAGNDTLRGGNGNDVLLGGPGTDVLLGGAGADVLNGGPGSDTLTGGAGADVFALGSVAHGLDDITDFNVAEDRFDLTVALQRFDSGDDIADFVQFRTTDDGTVLALNARGSGLSYTDVALMRGVFVDSLPLEQLGLTLTPEVTNPFPNPILPGDIVVDIVDFVQVPPGVVEPPLARLNGMTHADDGSGRLFVNDTRGPMYVIEDGVLDPTPILNLRVDLPNEWFHAHDLWDGFRDFAFHPDFENPGTAGFGKLYISFTGNIASAALHPDTPVFDLNRPVEIRHHDIIAELDVDPETLDVDLGSYRELMRIENPHDHHNIGELAFNPNAEPGDADYGMLYGSIGDAHLFFPRADALNVGQDRGVLPGSIIRIDPLQDGDQPYTVPGDNPFVGEAGVLPEIWAYGLR